MTDVESVLLTRDEVRGLIAEVNEELLRLDGCLDRLTSLKRSLNEQKRLLVGYVARSNTEEE